MNHTYTYLKQAWLKTSKLLQSPTIFVYLLSAILISIPLKFIFGSISCILFLLVAFLKVKKAKISFDRTLLLPILLYALMLFSAIWSVDLKSTTAGLQKEVLFLLIPLAFLVMPPLSKEIIYRVFRIYSFSMVGYALFYFLKALFRFRETGNKDVFFYHELVSLDLNAIYVAVFASFAIFYFISRNNKSTIERLSISILIVFVFLLSSKSIIFIDFLIIVCFYIYFSETPKSVKFVTIAAATFFLVFSMVFVKQIRERFLIEYETAFVDNTVNSNSATVHNISLKQAWYTERFDYSNFFPGGALRLYQIRIFKEMIQEDNILFTGYGLEASQTKIKQKEVEHNLTPGYGTFNFHNQYVQTFAELGLFGFLILVVMLGVNLKNAWKYKNFLHIVFAVTMIVLFLTESFFCRQRGIVFFITLFCMFNSVYRANEEKPKI